MNVVLLEDLGISPEKLEKYADMVRQAGHTFTAHSKSSDTNVLADECRDADVIMLANMKLPADVISQCSHLKMIDVAFTGVDHIGMEACAEKGIPVCNASGYSTQAVAELTISQMINLLRSVPEADKRCRAGQDKSGLKCRELSACTVGIVGTGSIGQRVASLCRAFGAKVIGYAPHRRPEAEKLLTYVDMDELLASSDIVSLHCPLNDSTRGMIGTNELHAMKSSACLVNMARGPVVDTRALAKALEDGEISGAAVDVFDTEPPLSLENPLLSAPNCICTPHIGFYSNESMDLRAEIVFDTLDAFFKGEIRRQVN